MTKYNSALGFTFNQCPRSRKVNKIEFLWAPSYHIYHRQTSTKFRPRDSKKSGVGLVGNVELLGAFKMHNNGKEINNKSRLQPSHSSPHFKLALIISRNAINKRLSLCHIPSPSDIAVQKALKCKQK